MLAAPILAGDWKRWVLAAEPGPRISVRPGRATGAPPPPGPLALGLSEGRDGALYVPRDYRPDRPSPLVLALHGAGGSGAHPVRHFAPLADELGALLVAPDSRGGTWDAIRGDFGPDVRFISLALAATWSSVQVDPARVSVVGFSDGATYALALGLANGELFSRVAAFSPGFLIPVPEQGNPDLFISHGTQDRILPINNCSRVIVPVLRRMGYRVDYREFKGGHTVPAEMARDGLAVATRSN
jgi:phospholipase/carboxylesterase